MMMKNIIKHSYIYICVLFLLSNCTNWIEKNNKGPEGGNNNNKPPVVYKVETPVIEPAYDMVVKGQLVTISDATSGATIYYNEGDGTQTDPNPITDTLYDPLNKPIIDHAKTIKANAYKDGYTDSDTATKAYFVSTVFAAGAFDQYLGASSSASSIIKLYGTNGSIDDSFDPVIGADGAVSAIVPLNDGTGRIFIGGAFTHYNGEARDHMALINLDGSLDETFIPDIGPLIAHVPPAGSPHGYTGPAIGSIVVQGSGSSIKIVAAGVFTSVKGSVTRNDLLRLNLNGSIDTTFNTGGDGPDDSCALTPLPSGDMFVSGEFSHYNGALVSSIIKIDSDGNRITAFDASAAIPGPSIVRAVTLQTLVTSNDRVLVGGWMSPRLKRLNSTTGANDATFHAAAINNGVYALAIDHLGRILIGGGLTSYDGHVVGYITRADYNGNFDATFNNATTCSTAPIPGTTNGVGADHDLYKILIQPDNNILIGSYFLNYDSVRHYHVARLDDNGCIEPTFDPDGNGVNAIVNVMALQTDGTTNPNGNVLLGGSFNSALGNNKHISKLYSDDGTLDISFTSRTGTNGDINAMVIQPSDQKIIIGGAFSSYRDTNINNIARLDIHGNVDTSFDPGSGTSDVLMAMALQSDEKIMIGGKFTSYNGTGRKYIARVNTDGSLDTSFVPTGSGLSGGGVLSIAVQPDGKILIGGFFTSYNGTGRNHIARLNANGSLDTTFDPGAGANEAVWAIAVQNDNKILIAGVFTLYDGTTRNHVARLNADGSLDTSFDSSVGAGGDAYALAIQSDGKVLIGGHFTSYDSTTRNHIARINTDGSLDTSFDSSIGANSDVYTLAIQGDGNILIGGDFSQYNSTARNYIARLHTDGSLDNDFMTTTNGFNNDVYAIAIGK